MTESRRLLRHFLAALAYRTQKALRGAPSDFAEFRAGPTARTPYELLWHMTGLIGYARTMLRGGEFEPPRLPSLADEVQRFHSELERLATDFADDTLTARIRDDQFLQGPLADAMTHAGQLAFLRRLYGDPIPSENFIFATVSADNLGPMQALPNAPDADWRADEMPQPPGLRRRHQDPFDGRIPTSHERLTGDPWDASYRDGPPPWDIGYPQPAFVRLAAATRFVGPILDVGCGTGENTLHVATLGFAIAGVDVAVSAVELARRKAAERGLAVDFAVADALHLEQTGGRFRTILDGGLFHTFDAEERERYASSLAAVTSTGGTLYVLCFSDDGPETGPHPISQSDLRAAFRITRGWDVATIAAERVNTRYHPDGFPAWLATIVRV